MVLGLVANSSVASRELTFDMKLGQLVLCSSL